MRNDFCSGYLMHHGIQGQKWGVRNGPPYPLDAVAKSSNDRKNSNKSSGLTDKQKKYITIGASVAATALATYGFYKLGGPKEVLRSARRLELMIKTGKKVSKPRMKMNLQYFGEKKISKDVKQKVKKLSKKDMKLLDEFGRMSFRGSQFQTRDFKDLSADEANSITMQAVRLWRVNEVRGGSEVITYPYKNHVYYIATDVPNGRIVGRQYIPESVTGLTKRIPYVVDEVVKKSKGKINGRED